MMDGKQLDTIARGLAREAPRRAIFGGVLGGMMAVLAGDAVSAQRRRRRRARRNRNASNETVIELPPGVGVGGVWEETIEMCHFDPSTGEYQVMAVPTTSVPEYLNQGDTLYIDCCVVEECSELPCLTPTSCIEGACAYDPVSGVPCALADGTTGVCNVDGDCVPSMVTNTAPVTSAPAPAPATTGPAPMTSAPAPVAQGDAPASAGETGWSEASSDPMG